MTEVKFPSPFYRVAAKAIIRNKEGGILLVKERTDSWSIPGGGLDHGEDLHGAVRREVLEELGVETLSISERPYCSFSALNTQFGVWCLAVCYEVEIDASENFNLGDGSTEARYFPPEEIKSTVKLEEADFPLLDFI